MEVIQFYVQGSSLYDVRFQRKGETLAAYCNCQAGEHGSYCKHRLRILCGNTNDIVSDNLQDVSKVVEWLNHSSLKKFLNDLINAESAYEKAKANLSLRKKMFSRALMGLRLDS